MSGIETQVENLLGNYVAAIRIVYTVSPQLGTIQSATCRWVGMMLTFA